MLRIQSISLATPGVQSLKRLQAALRSETFQVLAVSSLLVLSLAVRWPYLIDVPELTDEAIEIGRAVVIADGSRFPLTNYVAFTGPVVHYLLAGVFKLFGASLLTAKITMLLLGSATVVVVYLLGRELTGRLVGLLAAAFLATSSVHALLTSRIVWSHSVTPLLLTLTAWLLVRGLKRGSRVNLCGAAVLAGLTLQSHPTSLLAMPGFALYAAWRDWRLLVSRFGLLLIALVVLGYSNMIYYNITTGFDSISSALEMESTYTRTLPDSSRSYQGRAPEVFRTLFRLPGGDLSGSPNEPLAVPLVAGLSGVLALSGLLLLARRGELLPLLAVASLALLLPIGSAQHENLARQSRYLMPILPLLYIGLASVLAMLLLRVRAPLARGLLVGLVAVLVLVPIYSLTDYVGLALKQGNSNERYLQGLAILRSLAGPGWHPMVDWKLSQERTGGGGNALLSFQLLAQMEKRPIEIFADDYLKIAHQSSRYQDRLLVLSARKPGEMASKLKGSSARAEVVVSPSGSNPYYVYRVVDSTRQFTPRPSNEADNRSPIGFGS
jgi:hypothetical protein